MLVAKYKSTAKAGRLPSSSHPSLRRRVLELLPSDYTMKHPTYFPGYMKCPQSVSDVARTHKISRTQAESIVRELVAKGLAVSVKTK